MPRVLYVDGSPRDGASESRPVADAFLAAYRWAAGDVEVDRLDPFTLERFAADAAGAKMDVLARREHAPARAEAWAGVLATARRLAAADLLLVTAPMWNHAIPWALKLFVDTVTQPGVAFRFDPETGYHGLLGGRRAVVVYTSDVYVPGRPPGFGADFQSTYLEHWLRFVGIDRVDAIQLRPTWRGAPDLAERRAEALARARALGARS